MSSPLLRIRIDAFRQGAPYARRALAARIDAHHSGHGPSSARFRPECVRGSGPHRPLVLLGALFLLGSALTGCVHVAPWERGVLARRDMAVTPDPALRQLRDHMLVSKEATSGGHAGTSGGCGCN